MKLELDDQTKKNLLWMEVNFRAIYEKIEMQYYNSLSDSIRRVLAGIFDFKDLRTVIDSTHPRASDAYEASFIVSPDELKADPWVVPRRISSVGVALKKAAEKAGIEI